ncbi:OmpA family protein [Bowmanella pacifica]|uniref:OmpA-like domain-containing protein n=2 Tax=Bowmanella TaxID=366580 RepID=A0A917YY03_9ALTE|nr:OmpA family protein [Bowmanella pacifica]GGO67868.1 hypothetical protein GCM10010982_15430 [Bowmanella pacifica]
MTNFHVQRQALKELLVGFPSGSAKIPVTELDKLFQQAELIKQNPRSLAMIYGYRDHCVGAALPDSLALSRAEAVKRELISFGIRPSALHIVEDQDMSVPHPSLQGAAMTVLIQQFSVS